MDRLIYTNTFPAAPPTGEGLQVRTIVVDSIAGADLIPGNIQQAGRNLDMAEQRPEWIPVPRWIGCFG